MATASNFVTLESTFPKSCYILQPPPLLEGERVVWLGNEEPEFATVRWIGVLPEISSDWAAGIELDNPVGGIDGKWNGKALFSCPPNHGMIIAVNGLIKAKDFSGDQDDGDDYRACEAIVIEKPKHDSIVTESQSRKQSKKKEDGSDGAGIKGEFKGDRLIENFLSMGGSGPKSVTSGSFDRRVYARMFAECEVEKWYEAVDFQHHMAAGGSLNLQTVSLTAQTRDNKNRLGVEEGVKKSERGGIFRFFRWLRRNRSLKMQHPPGSARDSRSGGGGHRLSSARLAGRTKSLESVTSLSSSFHYIPAGVLCSEGDVSSYLQAAAEQDRVYEDLDKSPRPTPSRFKCSSLSRALADEREKQRREVRRPRLVRSACGDGSGMIGSSSAASTLSRKKRRAPLPPGAPPPTDSSKSGRDHWVKVLPPTGSPIGGKLNRRTAASTGAIYSGMKVTPAASNDNGSVVAFLQPHQRSASTTVAEGVPDSGGSVKQSPLPVPPRIGSHVKNKRRAPPPPSPKKRMNSQSSPKPGPCCRLTQEVIRSGAMQEQQKASVPSQGEAEAKSIAIPEVEKTQSVRVPEVEKAEPVTVPEAGKAKPQTLPEAGQAKPLTVPGAEEEPNPLTVPEADNSKPISVLEDEKAPLKSSQRPRMPENGQSEIPPPPSVDPILEALKSRKNSVCGIAAIPCLPQIQEKLTDKIIAPDTAHTSSTSETSNEFLDESPPSVLERKNSKVSTTSSSSSSDLSPGMLGDMRVLRIDEDSEREVEKTDVENESGGQSCAEASPGQMNLQALQELVESLVVQYCGNAKPMQPEVKKEDDRKPSPVHGELEGSGQRRQGTTMSQENSEPEVRKALDDIDEMITRKRFPVISSISPSVESGSLVQKKMQKLTNASSVLDFTGQNDGAVSSTTSDGDDLANKLLERWQARMMKQNSSDFIEISKKTRCSVSAQSEAGEEPAYQDNENSAGIYEPIGNFLDVNSLRNVKKRSLVMDGEEVEVERREVDFCKVSKVADADEHHIPQNPFAFWRDLCAKKILKKESSSMTTSSCRAKQQPEKIKQNRCVSVNGESWPERCTGGGPQGGGGHAELSSKGKNNAFWEARSPAGSWKEYENVFVASPHHVLGGAVDKNTGSKSQNSVAHLPPHLSLPYWLPPPLISYVSPIPPAFSQFHPLALPCTVGFGAASSLGNSHSDGFCQSPDRKHNSSRQTGSSSQQRGSRNLKSGSGYSQSNDHPVKDQETTRQASQTNVQNETVELSSDSEAEEGSDTLAEEEETEVEEERANSPGKKACANVGRRRRNEKCKGPIYANVPPTPPPRNSSSGIMSGSGGKVVRRPSSRLAAGCDWLKESSKSVQAKIKAARADAADRTIAPWPAQIPPLVKSEVLPIEPTAHCNAASAKPPSYAMARGAATLKNSLPVTSTAAGASTDQGDGGSRALANAPGRSSLAPAMMDNSVTIGGIKVPTPFNLWPLEYELVAPELKRLKAKLEGKLLPKNLMEEEGEEQQQQQEVTSEDVLEDNQSKSLAVSQLLLRLEAAISGGKLEEAATLARDLAQLKIQCSVTRNRQPSTESKESPIILNMFVEDKVFHHGPIPIRVIPSITVGELKRKIFREFEFPPAVQRWILGRKLVNDDDAPLSRFGVCFDGSPVFLFLLSADEVGIQSTSLELSEQKHECVSPTKPKREKRSGQKRTAKKIEKPEDVASGSQGPPPSNGGDVLSCPEQCSANQASMDSAFAGWQCPRCTLVNAPTRPGCAACSGSRPEGYVVPQEYVMRESESNRLKREAENEKAFKEAEERQRLQNWQEYLNLEDQDIVLHDGTFECCVCLCEVVAGEGVKLRDCLHTFCSDCLRNAIAHSNEAVVRCPYRDDQYSCDSVLQEREIRALVPKDVFERYLQRSMAAAESQSPNSFHCKTPDCSGWCFFEDNANEFVCPVCNHLNCITCRVIHEGQDCRQYQNQLAQLARTDEDARKTKNALEDMVQRGEAMKCPVCQVIIMKKWGCDWLCCSICKTEICWVTKGPRWGPKGRGDMNGGCRCGVLGRRCHPDCNYCH